MHRKSIINARFYSILFAICCCLVQFAAAQKSNDINLKMEFRFGLSCNLNYSSDRPLSYSFPAIKVFGAFLLTSNPTKYLQTNYGATISLYMKSLGNDRNPLNNDIEVDFANSFSIGAVFDTIQYKKYQRTIGNSASYNLVHQYKYAVFLSPVFILNNKFRNQVVGALNFTIGDCSLNYYNDGGAPIQWLGLGDSFDRWWTGGGGLVFHNNDSFNTAEVNFDQFTGYSPLIYELSNILGINVPDYNETRNSTPNSFNSSSYTVKYFLNRFYAAEIGVNGSLIFNGKHFGVQDIIHKSLRYSLHPNTDDNKFFYGVTFNGQIK